MNRMRLIAALATLAALVLLFVLVRPGGDAGTDTSEAPPLTKTTPPTAEPLTTGTEPTTVWRIDARESSIARRTVSKGTNVALRVVADTNDEVHVHGYDLERNVAPGNPARLAFRATIAGRFEIELENAGKQIAELSVLP